MGQILSDVKRSMLARFIALVVAFSALIAVGVLFSGLASNEDETASDGILLKDVDLGDLADGEITLVPVGEDFTPKVSSEVAEAEALKLPGVTVRETILARAIWPGFDNEVWVVNLDPGTYQGSGDPNAEFLYLITFVDADTGEFALTSMAEAPPPGGWTTGGNAPEPPATPTSTPFAGSGVP